ncbi:MAG: hypothetical protein KDB65_13475 [Calditrichaeota bacterium]|nr:hypothetical protein [Calditrichota bacterium]
MAKHTITYTDKVNPHTNQIIGSLVGEREDRPGFTYVLDVNGAPFRWRRYPNFAVSGQRHSLSDLSGQRDGFDPTMQDAFALLSGDFVRGRVRYMVAQGRLRSILEAYEQGQIPPMFDPDVESD